MTPEIARMEAARRSARTGIPEIIGRLPGIEAHKPSAATDQELRAAIMAAIGNRPITRSEVLDACGWSRRTRDMVDTMAAEGAITATVAKRATWYGAEK